MSPRRDKTVLQLVEKYRREIPSLERPLLRRLMRLENPQLFKDNPSNLKTLDRHLKKAFKNKEPSPEEQLSKPNEYMWKAIEEATRLYAMNQPVAAWKLLFATTCQLPSSNSKQKVIPIIQQFNAEFEKLKKKYGLNVYLWFPNMTLAIYNRYVPMLIEALSTALYAM